MNQETFGTFPLLFEMIYLIYRSSHIPEDRTSSGIFLRTLFVANMEFINHEGKSCLNKLI